MIIPVGEPYQQVLHLLTKQDGKLINESLRSTLFVPMTGKAEASRRVKAAPLDPKLVNSGFEEITGTSGEPRGWYYIRQMKVVTGNSAPSGQNYVTFTNSRIRDVAAARCKALRSTANRSTNWNFPAWSAEKTLSPAPVPINCPSSRLYFWTMVAPQLVNQCNSGPGGEPSIGSGRPGGLKCRSKPARALSISDFWAPRAKCRTTTSN